MLGAVLLSLWLPSSVVAQPKPVKDGSGKTVGHIDKDKTNCIGYACNTGGALDPVLDPADKRTSLKELFTALGYTCTSGISAKDCKAHCKGNEYMMLYVYITKEHDFDKVKKKYEGKDPFADPIITPTNELDYHGLRGGDSDYTYQSHRDDKANEKIETFKPTDAKPDYFGDPKQMLGKYCCCRAPRKCGEEQDDQQPPVEEEHASDTTNKEDVIRDPRSGGA